MSKVLLVAPILFPLLTGLLALAAWKYRRLQEIIALSGAFIFLLLAGLLFRQVMHHGIIHMQAGDWDAPFGITVVADTFSAVMVLITALMAVGIAVYSLSSMKYDGPARTDAMLSQRRQFAFYPLINIMYMGVCGAFLTGDLFNMYVWFEVMLMSSFILLSMDGKKKQLEGAFKYVTINLVSSAFFLIGIGLLYGITGTLNMADLAVKVSAIENQALVTLIAMFFLVCFGIKAAVFPLFFWLPASYHTPPISIAAIFAAMLTKVGVYSLVRIFSLIFIQDIGYTHTIILWIAAFTMFIGVIGAASHYDMRRILSVHIVSQIGYLILGLAFFTPLALAGVLYYMVHIIMVKGNLFLVAGLVKRIGGTYQIKKTGGLLNHNALLAVLFLISALALAGIPPLSGFWAKFIVLKAGVMEGQYLFVVVALVVSLLTLYSMMKIWNEAFWKKDPGIIHDDKKTPGLFSRQNRYMTLPVLGMTVIILIMGLFPEPFFQVAQTAAEELMDPSYYINTVLGGTTP